MNQIKQDRAVSEIIGGFLMLILIILTFSVIYSYVSSSPPPRNPPNVTIVGRVEDNNLVLENQRGESLGLDTTITVNMNIKNETILVKQCLDTDSIEDGEWNIGERAVYPLSFNIHNIRNHLAADLIAVDRKSDSLVFVGTLDVYPKTDIGITMTSDNLFPSVGSEINLTIVATNYERWDTPAINIEILYLLPDNLLYVNNVTSRGFYNLDTGIWNISYLESGEYASLTIKAIVKDTSIPEPTQLAMLLDGSLSIIPDDWDLMRTGLANAIENPEVFPHDKSVELTVIQFGGQVDPWGKQYAQIEVEGPNIVAEDNYGSIGTTIRNLPQLGGYTPMGCAIYLAADTLNESWFLGSSNRQVICLVTDGQPNCNRNQTTYTGKFVNDNYVTGRAVAEQGRNYSIDILDMTSDQDQFSAIAVGQYTNTTWLKNNIVWPEPGNYAPPYKPGWVRNVSSWQDFSEAINEIFRVIFGDIHNNVEIIAKTPTTDPNLENNYASITIRVGNSS